MPDCYAFTRRYSDSVGITRRLGAGLVSQDAGICLGFSQINYTREDAGDDSGTIGIMGMDKLDEALEYFTHLVDRAKQSDLREPMAMALATVNGDGQPASRHVLLKTFDRRGFTFFTNYESRKAGQLKDNPFAALCFYWQPLNEQVQIEGRVHKLSADESEQYWQSRPRGSQLGAWASKQSRPLMDREMLLRRIEEMAQRYEDEPVPRPHFWGGYRLAPVRIEFWRGHPDRLNERLSYEQQDGRWCMRTLYP